MRRSELSRSVRESEGVSVYDALVAHIDFRKPAPTLSLLRRLNESQRTLVAVGQVHEHAQFNGLRASLKFHGREVVEMAANGAARLGKPNVQEILREALEPDPDWTELERRWDAEAGFEIEPFIEAHASDFFLDES